MSDYVVFTDSCADLGSPMVAELGLEIIPLTFTMDGKDYENWPDGRDMGFADFYAGLRGGSMSSTSQVNRSTFIDAFTPFLKDGKDVLYLAFSSGLSGTAESAMLAAKDLSEQFKANKVVVVDTLAASLGQGLLVWHAMQLKRAGKNIDEVAKWAQDNKLNLAHWFTVDDLNFLKRGGRVSGAQALLGTMLGIKPVMHVDDTGHLIPMHKVRGRKQSLKALVDHMQETATDPKKQMVFISHGDCLEEAEQLAEDIKARLGVKDIYINFIGPVIGSHSGPGTMALFFFAKKR